MVPLRACIAYLRGVMTGQDTILAAFAAAHPDGHMVVTGRPGARYLMGFQGSLTTFLIDGEPDTKDFTELFDRVFADRLFAGVSTVLIDLIAFTGAVDWGAVKALHDRTACHALRLKKIAYLVRDVQFAPLAKIAGAIFAETEHVAFIDRQEALAWLSAPG